MHSRTDALRIPAPPPRPLPPSHPLRRAPSSDVLPQMLPTLQLRLAAHRIDLAPPAHRAHVLLPGVLPVHAEASSNRPAFYRSYVAEPTGALRHCDSLRESECGNVHALHPHLLAHPRETMLAVAASSLFRCICFFKCDVDANGLPLLSRESSRRNLSAASQKAIDRRRLAREIRDILTRCLPEVRVGSLRIDPYRPAYPLHTQRVTVGA